MFKALAAIAVLAVSVSASAADREAKTVYVGGATLQETAAAAQAKVAQINAAAKKGQSRWDEANYMGCDKIVSKPSVSITERPATYSVEADGTIVQRQAAGYTGKVTFWCIENSND